MEAPFTLRAKLKYSRPRFYPGQILPDTALTNLGEFSAANLEAVARRSGWGVVQGLAPRVAMENGNAIVHVSPGVAVDQAGRMIVIEDAGDKRLDQLVAAPAAKGDGTIAYFDLWLSVDCEKDGGGQHAWCSPSGDGADPPIPAPTPQKDDKPKQCEKAGDPAGRPPRQVPVAKLELRPADDLDDLGKKREEAYENFKKAFHQVAQPTDQTDKTLDEVQKARLALLAQELDKPPPPYNGIPLGRIGIEVGTGKPHGDFDLAYARTEARNELPAPHGQVNLARVLGMEPDAARAWLTAHGFQPWTEDVIVSTRKLDHMAWDLALRPGDTVRLFAVDVDGVAPKHNKQRIAVARKGPSLPREWEKFQDRLTSVENVMQLHSWALIFLAVVLFAAIAAAWTNFKDLERRVPKAEVPSLVSRVV